MCALDSENQSMSLHKLASVGLVKSFGTEIEWFGYRRDMTTSSLKFLIQEFVEKIEQAQTEMVSLLPESIKKGLEHYQKMRKDTTGLSFETKKLLLKKLNFLEKMMSLPVYSWNGERYDLFVLLGPLIHTFSAQPKKFKHMKIIKRGTSFMEIKFGYIYFRDFHNFSVPISLGKNFIYVKSYIFFLFRKFRKI